MRGAVPARAKSCRRRNGISMGCISWYPGILHSFESDEVLESLPPANGPKRASFDQDLGGTVAEVVVGGHREPVGSGVADGEQIPFGGLGKDDVAGEEIARLADRPDNVRIDRVSYRRVNGFNRMDRAIQRRAD